jgi:hypothetical protein
MYLPFTATVRLAGGRALIVPEYVLYNIVTNSPFYGQAHSHTFSHDLFSPTVSSFIKEYKSGIIDKMDIMVLLATMDIRTPED